MKLTRINYSSAVFFGAFALIFYFISGLVQWILASRIPAFQAAVGIISPVQLLIVVPLIGGVIVYLLTLITVWIYNAVAKKNPISWKVSK